MTRSEPAALRRLYALCRAGQLPAEVLGTEERSRLVRELWAANLSDVQVASLTRMTTYTAARIRAGLGLTARPHDPKEIAA